MILSTQSIRDKVIITPFHNTKEAFDMSFGLYGWGYGVRIMLNKGSHELNASQILPGGFLLATTVEMITTTPDVMGMLVDKSAWARRGLSLFNTILKPQSNGHVTLQLVNHSEKVITIEQHSPIADIIFMRVGK